jgi:questin oxidase-like protein
MPDGIPYAAMDEALAILKDTGPEFGMAELSNHGPMGAEALCAMGRAESVKRWTERYRRRLQPRPGTTARIRRDGWREALGDFKRAGDWVAFFESELDDAPWPDVLDRWVEILAPGMIAAAFHGLIRTGHAARSLSMGENPARRRELAEGLGYWAARYHTLPESRGARGCALPSRGIDSVALLPEEKRDRAARNITDRLQVLDPSFAGAIDLVGSDIPDFLSDLTETFAHVYLAGARDALNVIALIHAVTGPAAIRLMAVRLRRPTLEKALRYCWQGAGALYAAFGVAARVADVETPAEDVQALIDRAIASGDEHAIKFTEACIREHTLKPAPVYLAAALNASDALGGRRRARR